MASLQPNHIPPMTDRIKVTLKQGPVLEGRSLIAALRRLVEIGKKLEKEVERQ